MRIKPVAVPPRESTHATDRSDQIKKAASGKTTTTVNLAAALAGAGKRVCVVDLDPQAHASTHLGIEPDGTNPSLYDVLVSNKPIAEVRQQAADNLWLLPSDINLAAAEVELAGIVGREVILREALAQDPETFDFMVMDCGPSLGVLTLNALATVDEVFIPLQPHFLALHGLSKLLETTALVARRINPKLTVTGVVVCLCDAATKLAQEVVNDLSAFLTQSRGANVPWGKRQSIRDEDSTKHQAGRVPELREIGVRLCSQKQRCRGLHGSRERGAGVIDNRCRADENDR